MGTSNRSIKGALNRCGISYKIDEGGGAFYGPKIDIKITDAIGRKWQCGTVQIDMNLPERFDLTYTDENNTAQQPVMIHRAILGSFERFVAILTEHFGGEFPFFVAPTQVIIIPINEAQNAYAKELHNALLKVGVYAEIEEKSETLNKRIRNAEKQRVPIIAVLGAKEMEERKVAVRNRRTKEQSDVSFDDFIQFNKEKMREVSF